MNIKRYVGMSNAELIQELWHKADLAQKNQGAPWDYSDLIYGAIRRLEYLLSENASKWLDAKRCPPELTAVEKHNVEVFGWLHAPEYIVMIEPQIGPTTLLFNGKEWADVEGRIYPVTHWMPLPEPPSTGESHTGQKG